MMRVKIYTLEEARGMLKEKVRAEGGTRAFGRKYGTTAHNVSMQVTGYQGRHLGAASLKALGLKKMVVYGKVEE